MRSRQLADNVRWNNSPAFVYRVENLRQNVSDVLLRTTTALTIPGLYLPYEDVPFVGPLSYAGAIDMDSRMWSSTMASMTAAFFEHIGRISDPLVQCISKCIKCKCRTRKSSAVWKRKTNIPAGLSKKLHMASNETERKLYTSIIASRSHIYSTFSTWMLCSLLGNYQHSNPDTRLKNPKTRRFVYDLFQTEDHAPFVAELMSRCWNLNNFAIREYMVYAIRDMPAFERELNTMFDVYVFEQQVIDAMDSYRAWFANELENRQLVLDMCTYSVHGVTSTGLSAFFDATKQHFETHHDNIKPYYASIPTVERELEVRRSQNEVPLIPLPVEVLAREQSSSSDAGAAAVDACEENGRGYEELDDWAAVLDGVDSNGSTEWSDDDEDSFDPNTDAYTQRHLDAFDARDREKMAQSQRKLRGIDFTKYMPALHIHHMREVVRKHVNKHVSSLTYVQTDTLLFVIKYARVFGRTNSSRSCREAEGYLNRLATAAAAAPQPPRIITNRNAN
jgi:hypothetical protein